MAVKKSQNRMEPTSQNRMLTYTGHQTRVRVPHPHTHALIYFDRGQAREVSEPLASELAAREDFKEEKQK